MAFAQTATTNKPEDDWLTSAFAVAATGTALVAGGVLSAPIAVGAFAALAGIGMLNRAVTSDEGNTNVALVASIAAVVTSFVVGLPVEFLSEAIVFPWAHDTAFGAKTMEASGSVLVPFYDTIGSWFGIEPFGTPTGGAPIADI